MGEPTLQVGPHLKGSYAFLHCIHLNFFIIVKNNQEKINNSQFSEG